MVIEACIEGTNQAMKAQQLGASQIELCDRLDLDGTSPSIKIIEKVLEKVSIPVKVIINPKPYDYKYSDSDIKEIITYIRKLNTFPLSGIVFGPLTNTNLPHLDQIQKVSESTPFPITFHKAIDQTSNILESTLQLKKQGIVHFILSSGGKQTALKGKATLKKMNDILQDSPIELIGAGKITKENLQNLHQRLQLNYYHGKRIVGNLS